MQNTKHLVDIYIEFVNHTQYIQKVHFTSHELETVAMDPIPQRAGPSNTKTPSNEEGSLDIDDMLVELSSNDIFGDLN